MKGKTKLLPPSNPAAHAVANGEAEIGMTQISEILPYPGAELVGPLPEGSFLRLLAWVLWLQHRTGRPLTRQQTSSGDF